MKEMKKSTKIILIVLASLFVLNNAVNITTAIINYAHNKSQEVHMQDGFITNQGKLTNIKLGHITADRNSCGTIATYNFLKLNNRRANYKNILWYYDAFGLNVYGYLGVNPFAIQRYLMMRGFNASITTNMQEMPQLAKDSGTSIFLYFHNQGAHYITLEYNAETQKYKAYNYVYGKVIETTIPDILAVEGHFSGFAMLIYLN